MNIRPLTPEGLPGVAALFERVMRSGLRTPAPGLQDMFGRLLFEAPWSDPEIPSLVAVDDGAIVGFLGSHVRRLRVDGRTVRLACSGQLVADPDVRHPAIGGGLLRTYMHGPQDCTITDGATDVVRAMWTRLGGQVAHPHAVEWILALRPWRLAAALAGRAAGSGGAQPPRAGETVLAGLDRITEPVTRRLLSRVASPSARDTGRLEERRATPGPVTTEPLTPAALVEGTDRLSDTLRVTPAYDLEFAGWLLDEMRRVEGRGELVARLVRHGDTVAGWFVYYLAPGGLSATVQVAGRNEAEVATVLDALIEHARDGGAAALHGRTEDRLLKPITARGALLRYTGNALIHARDPALIALATSHASLLTRMEGEWWMGPHLGPAAQRHRP